MHSEEFHDLYTSPNIISMMKMRTMRCTVHVACIRQTRHGLVLVGNPEGKKQF